MKSIVLAARRLMNPAGGVEHVVDIIIDGEYIERRYGTGQDCIATALVWLDSKGLIALGGQPYDEWAAASGIKCVCVVSDVASYAALCRLPSTIGDA